ncbi:MAG: glycosyltransferase [Campylobacterota bacterium]|nr:glycosyltransferase [Campylobacterota bacterium]
MKILQFIASSGWGGAEKSFVELCNGLSQHLQIEVLLFKENDVEKKLDPNIKIYRLSSHSDRHNPFLYIEAIKLIKKIKPGVVHTHGAKASEIIYNLNKFIFVKHVATKRNPRKGSIFNKVNHVIAISQDVVKSISKEDVKLIYNGLLLESNIEKKSANPVFTLLAVGRLDKIKGFDILIKEVAKLDFPFHLNIVGEGEERKNLETLITNLALSKKVSLLGFREDIPSLIASADIVIVSSHSEGFGRVVVETLFYGKLMLSTKVGISIEILPDELLIDDFEIAKKIDTVHNSIEHYHTLFQKLKDTRTQEFLVENCIQKHIDFYTEIQNVRGRSGEIGISILMVSLDYLPTVGGITAHVYELSQALKNLGCNVSIVTKSLHKDQKEFETLEGIDVHRFDLKFVGCSYGYQINHFIEKLTDKKHFDIIHIHGMRPLEFYNIKEIPLVYTNHTSGYLKRIRKGGYRIPLLKRLFAKPKLFLAPSEELLEVPFDIQAKKVFISNGVISDKFTRNEEVRNQLRSTLGIKNDEVLAIVTRRMVWKNGLTYLAKSTKYIKNSKVKFLFIGDGEAFNEVKSILEENFKNRFMLLGAKNHDEIVDYYSASDLSILPSLMEATSISGLEAMAASLPLVGTRVGGIPVLIKDGENGYLCEPENPQDLAEKIDKLLDSDYAQMGKRSKEFVDKNFDWMKIAEHTLQEYQALVK